MAKKVNKLPSMEELVDFLRNSEYKVGKREIANAFNIKGDDRIKLKQMLKNLDNEGIIERNSRKDFTVRNELKSPATLLVIGTNRDGELIARPENYKDGEKVPTIIITDEGNITPKIGVNDMVLAKVTYQDANLYYAKVLKRISASGGRVVGIYETNGRDGHLLMIDRQIKTRFIISQKNAMNAKNNDIVVAEIYGDVREKTRPAKIVKIIGSADNKKAATTISIAKYDLPVAFSSNAMREAELMPSYEKSEYKDLTDFNFVTVDGADAKDFDDAVFVNFDKNGEFTAYVAIADVAAYVKYGSYLDIEARERGNSVYFPDQAIHMLPSNLASDLCSLKEGVDRPTLVCEMDFSIDGHKNSHKFYRAIIKSKARLTYTEVMDAFNQKYNENTEKVRDDISNLHKSYQILKKDSLRRGALLIDSPENKIDLDKDGNVRGIIPRIKDGSTEMIEELMVRANISAAETLIDNDMPALFRVHEKPSAEKLYDLYEFLSQFNVEIDHKKEIKADDFNKVIYAARETEFYSIINDMVLRSQMKAYYSTENLGHFGLALENYVHFTSPIRRYADLITARGLIKALNLGEGGFKPEEIKRLDNTAVHISSTERQAEQAERDAVSRYVSSFMVSKINKTFDAYVSGVSKFGLFVRIKTFEIEGFVPISKIKNGLFSYDNEKKIVIDYNSGIEYKIGNIVKAKLEEVLPLVGGLTFSIQS